MGCRTPAYREDIENEGWVAEHQLSKEVFIMKGWVSESDPPVGEGRSTSIIQIFTNLLFTSNKTRLIIFYVFSYTFLHTFCFCILHLFGLSLFRSYTIHIFFLRELCVIFFTFFYVYTYNIVIEESRPEECSQAGTFKFLIEHMRDSILKK